MVFLPLANIAHRKLRSSLAALAVGIGIAMLITMLGLTHGTLNEVANRMGSIEAELFVLPAGDSVIFTGGGYFGEKYESLIAETTAGGRRVVERVIPVFWGTTVLGGQKQRIFGIDRDDLDAFFGAHRIVEGRKFDKDNRFKAAVGKIAAPNGAYDTDAIAAEDVASGCELIIDTRLKAVGGYSLDQTVTALGREFRLVGVVESGVAGRVFAPIQIMRHIENSGLRRATMYCVQLSDPRLAGAAADAIAARTGARVELKDAFGAALYESFGQIYMYINIASAVALIVCFLLILLTMYTMVLERTREIGILKSLGASKRFLLAGAVVESLLICSAGTAAGILMACGAKYVIEAARPLLTVSLEARWLILALLVGTVGGVLSALYPGYRAAKLDPVTALAFE